MFARAEAKERDRFGRLVAESSRFLDDGEEGQVFALALVSRWPLLATFRGMSTSEIFEHLVVLTDRRLVLVKLKAGRGRLDRVAFASQRCDISVLEYVPAEEWAWIHLDIRNRDGVIERMRFSHAWEREAAAILRALWR